MIDESDVSAYEHDGVVCLRRQFDARWVERLRAAIERDLASPGAYATNFAQGSTAGTFFGDMFMWKQDADFRAAALQSPAGAIAARLMRSASVDFFYDQLFVKEPGTAHPTHGPERSGIPLGGRLPEPSRRQRAVLVAAAVLTRHTDDSPGLSWGSAGRWRRW